MSPQPNNKEERLSPPWLEAMGTQALLRVEKGSRIWLTARADPRPIIQAYEQALPRSFFSFVNKQTY